MHHLENVHIASDRNLIDFRMPVQYVNRPNLDFRGFCGTIASGTVSRGDTVMALPSKKTSKVKSIVTYDGDIAEAFAPAGGHDYHRGRNRHQPWRYVGAARQSAHHCRQVRRHDRVDGRRAAAAGQGLPVQAGMHHGSGTGEYFALRNRRQHAAPQPGGRTKAQRNRPLPGATLAADRTGRLPPQQRDRGRSSWSIG